MSRNASTDCTVYGELDNIGTMDMKRKPEQTSRREMINFRTTIVMVGM